MKKILTFLFFLPFFANAQSSGEGFNFGALIGFLIAIGVAILIFLALRQMVLWYWKIDTLVAYQEQHIKALQSVYDRQQEQIKAANQQVELLTKINENLSSPHASMNQGEV